MGLLDFFSKAVDEPDEQQFEHVRNLRVQHGAAKMCVACSEIPGARGEFGSAGNPIPVNGAGGEINYLQRLRLANGERILFHRCGSMQAAPSRMPLDQYEVVATDASVWKLLYFHMYHPKRSTKTPRPFRLVSWDKMDQLERASAYLPQWGVNLQVPDFPTGLPAVMRALSALPSVGPKLGPKMAEEIRQIIERHPGAWARPIDLS